MATLGALKQALREAALSATTATKQPLSDTQYSTVFDILLQGSEWNTYEDFIIPQLCQLLTLNSRARISVLEIGPGPKSILGYLPGRFKRMIEKYTAFEPNTLFATQLAEWLCTPPEAERPLPGLESLPNIHRGPFTLGECRDNNEKYDIILFCHSMYSMKPKRRFIEHALEMLPKQSPNEMVVVFHREVLHFDGLVCQQTASYPAGAVSVLNTDESLDRFASFVAGFTLNTLEVNHPIREDWRTVCRQLGRRESVQPNHLFFNSPSFMAAFTQHAKALPELTAQVSLANADMKIKNREACVHGSAAIFRPTNIQHVQKCVQWALKHKLSLTIIGGSHSGHCILPNVVSVDMSAFDKLYFAEVELGGEKSASGSSAVVVVESGCKTGDIISKTMAEGVSVPLGARPSVGAGLWLQGGIGHLARLHGLACDAVVGAVFVSVDSSQIFYVGCVPAQHRPTGAIRPENESEILWAMKGAGTNFGIVLKVTFQTYPAPQILISNWVHPLNSSLEARLKFSNFDELVARSLDQNCSVDAYLYFESGRLQLGVTMFEVSTSRQAFGSYTSKPATESFGLPHSSKIVDSVELFETEMYMSGMHGGHGGGKTSSFKRCLFLKNIGDADIASRLVAAMESRPSLLCYLHLLHGGGAVNNIAADASAFGCRDWDYACVITGVWPRDEDNTAAARSAIHWVYEVVEDMLPLSDGVYSADLGPDSRDAPLAANAFGPNLQRLGRLKSSLDPHNVLAYTCPVPKVTSGQKLIIFVTGDSCAGKDYCADIWASLVSSCTDRVITVDVVSISDEIKRDYARSTGADLKRLLRERAYKEEHRPKLTAFYQEKTKKRPRLPEEQFLSVVSDARNVDVLLITGMRDVAPVATFSHLVPDKKLLEVRVQTDERYRKRRKGHDIDSNKDNDMDNNDKSSSSKTLAHHPDFIFENNTPGVQAVQSFAEINLLPFIHRDFQRLSKIIRQIPNFPHAPINFHHILGIAQQPNGLTLCTSLLRKQLTNPPHAIIACEAGGFIYASALASTLSIPLILIREAGKLPPPTISILKPASHISSLQSQKESDQKRIEIERNVLPVGEPVLVVDDVLSTGRTLCAVLELLRKAGVEVEDMEVMVVAEFPIHGGRKKMLEEGFGRVRLGSLLVVGDA
jgi:adenine phosphoribosyltransferase/phosphomevalonate kinase